MCEPANIIGNSIASRLSYISLVSSLFIPLLSRCIVVDTGVVAAFDGYLLAVAIVFYRRFRDFVSTLRISPR